MQKHTRPYDVLTLLLALSVLLIAFQYTTVSKLIILKQDFRFEFFEFIKVIRQVITFTSTDVLIGGGIFLAFTTAVGLCLLSIPSHTHKRSKRHTT